MKTINFHPINDSTVYAVLRDGMLHPISHINHEHENPTYKINYDSSEYLHQAISDIEQHICNLVNDDR